MDYQVEDRENYRGSQTDGGRVNGQSQNSARKQEHAKHGKIHGFINFQNEIANNETNGGYYEAPVHPNSHMLALPSADEGDSIIVGGKDQQFQFGIGYAGGYGICK
jgi:hypothetical protein